MAATAVLTGAQFDALPYEEGRRWELLDGELIPVPSPTPKHQLIVKNIQMAIERYFRDRPGHGTTLADVEFALDENYRVRPDVLVLLPDRLASIDWDKVPVPGAPDIAIEVISASERAFDSQQKVDAYLRHGTQEVWQVYPKSKTVVMYRGTTGATFSCGDQIATPLLPGFSLLVESLF